MLGAFCGKQAPSYSLTSLYVTDKSFQSIVIRLIDAEATQKGGFIITYEQNY